MDALLDVEDYPVVDTDNLGLTALMHAVIAESGKCIEALVSYGHLDKADVNESINLAVRQNYARGFKILINTGAEVNFDNIVIQALNNNLCMILLTAVEMGENIPDVGKAVRVCYETRNPMLLLALLERNVVLDDYTRAVALAVEKGNSRLIAHLYKANIPLNLSREMKQANLVAAIRSGNRALVEVMLAYKSHPQHCVDIESDIVEPPRATLTPRKCMQWK